MEFSEEWKSVFPISSVFEPPLLHRSKPNITGPLFFNPSPKTLTLLFSSPSLSPLSFLSPPPHLSLSRFLHTSSEDFIPLSLSSSDDLCSAADDTHEASSVFLNNRIPLLHCFNNTLLVFFPTGENSDRVGFLQLFVKDSSLSVPDEDSRGNVLTAMNKFNHRIFMILVNPVHVEDSVSVTVGYLLACTRFSVHWFSVRIKGVDKKPGLVYLGGKVFKSCGVVSACWSPHLTEESVVLIESGDLFLFDLDSTPTSFKGTKLRVSWDGLNLGTDNKWLWCEFSWHPRILIVARSDSVFLVDLRFDECNANVTCLAKIEMLGFVEKEKDWFVAFSKAGSDGFYFTVATNNLLLLCDVRKPLMPVLQWNHHLHNPCYIDVFRLSELRSHSKRNDEYKWASESGFCIIMGSFWNDEFSLFCYGPSLPAPKGSVRSKISKFCKSFYAWELPSDLLLSGHVCRCGSCLVREDEFLKDALPEWIDWQQKKAIVWGFGILHKNLSMQLSKPDEFGGFTLIRLMSSGKLESQRYSASWDCVNKFEHAHKKSLLHNVENYLLYSMGNEEYKFPKKFKYIKLDYLYGFLNGNLTQVLVSSFKEPRRTGPQEKKSCSEILCEKLKACGIIQSESSPAVLDVFKDISFPTSIHEVALRRMWTGLPMDILQSAFPSYSEFLQLLVDNKEVSLEFLVVPDQLQLPPFFLRKPSNRQSYKIQHRNDLVGPVLPLPFLYTLHEVCNNGSLHLEEAGSGGYSSQLILHCDEIKRVAREMDVSDSISKLQNDHAVSLADDSEKTRVRSKKSKSFFLHNQAAFSDKSPNEYPTQDNSDYKDERFATLISKKSVNEQNARKKTLGLEMFDDLCPVELKFDSHAMNFGKKELKAYKLLKKQFSNWQEGFNSYQDYCTQLKFQNT